MRVDSASDRRLTSVLSRPDLVLTKGPEIPPQGAELGGMSGGPVFRITGTDDIELVAVIKEDSQLFDAYFFAPFVDVVLDPKQRIAIAHRHIDCCPSKRGGAGARFARIFVGAWFHVNVTPSSKRLL